MYSQFFNYILFKKKKHDINYAVLFVKMSEKRKIGLETTWKDGC